MIRRLRREARETPIGLRASVKALIDAANDEQFWAQLKFDFMNEVGDAPNELLIEGVTQAGQLGLAVDFDLVNQEVLDFSGQFTNEWWERTALSTRTAMRSAIQNNIATGAPLRDLERSLEPLFGRGRARVIASTETTRMFAEGNRIGYRSAGVERVEFQTVKDARVDPLCQALQGKKLSINDQSNFPPIHPSCRCWIAPITEAGEVLKDPAAGGRVTSELEGQMEKSSLGRANDLGGGINKTSTAHLQGDGDVVLKPLDGLRRTTLRTGIEPLGDIPREVSAFRVDQHLGGIGRVPETIARADTPLGESMMQAFVEDSRTLTQSRIGVRNLAKLDDYALYDAVIGNLDRHQGNVLIGRSSSDVFMIDHGLAFPTRVRISSFDGNMVFMDTVEAKQLSSEHRRLLRSFFDKRKGVTEELAGLGLENDAIEGMFERVNWMLENNQYMTTADWAEFTTAAYA